MCLKPALWVCLRFLRFLLILAIKTDYVITIQIYSSFLRTCLCESEIEPWLETRDEVKTLRSNTIAITMQIHMMGTEKLKRQFENSVIRSSKSKQNENDSYSTLAWQNYQRKTIFTETFDVPTGFDLKMGCIIVLSFAKIQEEPFIWTLNCFTTLHLR